MPRGTVDQNGTRSRLVAALRENRRALRLSYVQVAAALEAESRNTSETLAWDVKIDSTRHAKGAYYSQAPNEWYDSHRSEDPSTRSKST